MAGGLTRRRPSTAGIGAVLGGTARRVLRSPVVELLTGPSGVDRYLEAIRPGLSVRDARAEVIAIRHQTRRSVTVRLRANTAWQGFSAGQFVPIGVEIDGVRRTRTFSPASSQYLRGGRQFELTITERPGGLVTGYLCSRLARGAVVHLGAALGEFTLSNPRPQRLFLISGGSGITPVLSMLRTLCEENHDGDVTFLHFARTASDWLYQGEAAALAAGRRGMRVRYLATREGDGHLSLAALGAAPGGLADATVAVSGPDALVTAVRQLWQDHGGDPDRVLTETFTRASLAPPSTSATGNAAFPPQRW